MAKKVVGQLKLQVKAGSATPSPPIGPALGQRGINIMEFCKAVNAQTQEMEKGSPIPVVITYYADKSFTFVMKTPPVSYFLKKAVNLTSGSMAKIAKRVAKSREGLDPNKAYALGEAITLLKQKSSVKFDETIEVSLNLGVDPRHADQMVRGVVNLPNGTGRTVRVAVFARGAKADEAKAAGADIVGAEDLVETVQKGEINFDRCIATPDLMPLVGRLGKVLGPRGMMPNPKVGTVTMDVAAAVKASKGGAVEFRVEKAGIVHAGVGKVSFETAALEENVRALADAVNKAKPTGAKGVYMKKMSVSSTMGPGLKVDLASVNA